MTHRKADCPGLGGTWGLTWVRCWRDGNFPTRWQFKGVSTVETRIRQACQGVGVTEVRNIKDSMIIITSISFASA